MEKMTSLSSEIRKKIQTILFELTKHEKKDGKTNGLYAQMYRLSLTYKNAESCGVDTIPEHDLLVKLKKYLDPYPR